MNFYADSKYIHAKICGLHSRLLSAGDFYDLAKSGNIRSIVPGLESINIKNDYSLIKESIFKKHSDTVISLAEACSSSQNIFLLFLHLFELQNLKLLCAKAFNREPSPVLWYDIGDFAALNREMLESVTGMDVINQLTARTWMMGFFLNDTPASFEDCAFLIDGAALGIALDLAGSMHLSRKSHTMKLLSGIVAYFRITWSRRLQEFYAWDAAEIQSYIESNLVPAAYSRELNQYVLHWEARFMKLSGGDGTVNITSHGPGLGSTERAMERMLIRHISRMFHEDFHSVNTVTCYLVLLYRQVRNLFAIVDGLRFGIPPELIIENVICEA